MTIITPTLALPDGHAILLNNAHDSLVAFAMTQPYDPSWWLLAWNTIPMQHTLKQLETLVAALVPPPVSEPSALALAVLGVVGLAIYGLQKRRQLG